MNCAATGITVSVPPDLILNVIIAEYLLGGALTFARAAFHITLEVVRAMFAREMDVPLAHFFIARDRGVLADQPAGVTAAQVGIADRIAQRGDTVISRAVIADYFRLYENARRTCRKC